VMVLPVTAKMLVDADEVASSLGAKIKRQPTGLDEDLHLDGVLGCMGMCIDKGSDDRRSG
jgi:hypothetical protein